MKKQTISLAVASALLVGGSGAFGGKPLRKRAAKTCLNCGAMHFHKNSYCSAECCKAHEAPPHQGKD